jgi:hypothetical protein
VRGALYRSLLGLPHFLEVRVFPFQRLDLVVEGGAALLRRLVRFLLQRLALDLELDDAPLEPIHRFGLGVDLHADARSRLVDQVDGLVRQLAVADVAVRKRCGRDDRGIGDADAVVNFVALLQAAQDRDRVLDRRLVHQHFLEAPLQRRVLLQVLAILVERGRADAMQLAARQRGLEHVAGVHRALGLAGADHRVQLVDEQDDLAFLLREVVEHGLEALLELAAVLGAGDQRAHVEREDAFAAQAFRYFAVDDALRETFDDRRLADAGLADQHGIVLGASLQHLHGATDLVVAADDRIELALLRPLGQIDRVLLECLPTFLGIGVGDLLTAAHFLDGLVDRALHRAGIAQDRAELALVLERREHEQLAGDVLVAALLRDLVRDVEDAVQLVRDVHLAAGAFDLRQAVERLAQLRAQQVHVGAGLVEQVPHRAALLIQQGRHHVQRLDVLMIAADRERLGIRQRQLELARQFVHAHGGNVGDKPRISSVVFVVPGEKTGESQRCSIRDHAVGPPVSMLRC